MIPLSLYEQHVQRWSKGCGATICPYANRICYGRGTVPCDVVFIGQAPGNSEDITGEPMTGPAGQMLDHWIANSLPTSNQKVTYAITNLVGCLPYNLETGEKDVEPDHEDIMQCSERLQEFLSIARPKLIVNVGRLSDHYFNRGYRDCVWDADTPRIMVDHPAYLLRMNYAQRQQKVRLMVIRIRDAVKEYVLQQKEGEE